MARRAHKDSDLPFFEIFVDTPIQECERRDVKGLYKKARKGDIKGFTGVDQVYEKPDDPDLVVKTVDSTIEESTMQVVELLTDKVISATFWFFYPKRKSMRKGHSIANDIYDIANFFDILFFTQLHSSVAKNYKISKSEPKI